MALVAGVRLVESPCLAVMAWLALVDCQQGVQGRDSQWEAPRLVVMEELMALMAGVRLAESLVAALAMVEEHRHRQAALGTGWVTAKVLASARTATWQGGVGWGWVL